MSPKQVGGGCNRHEEINTGISEDVDAGGTESEESREASAVESGKKETGQPQASEPSGEPEVSQPSKSFGEPEVSQQSEPSGEPEVTQSQEQSGESRTPQSADQQIQQRETAQSADQQIQQQETAQPADQQIQQQETVQPAPQQVQQQETVQPAPQQIQQQAAAQSAAPQPESRVRPVPKSKKLRVLLVGNSITYGVRNHTISYLKKLAKRSGRKLVIVRMTARNEKMKNWANRRSKSGKRLYRAVNTGKWDYIILQEQTDAAVGKGFVKAGRQISEYIKRKKPKTQVVWNCTWAYKKGRRVGGKFYKFSRMQELMNRNYQTVAERSGSRVCWSGKAFLAYRNRNGKKKNLYRRDNNHGSDYGCYLNACCMYSSIFGVSPEESRFYGGLNRKQAKLLQKIAAGQCLI